MSMPLSVRITGEMTASAAVLTTLMDYLPKIAAVVAILWYVIQIWESDTVRGWRAYVTNRFKSKPPTTPSPGSDASSG